MSGGMEGLPNPGAFSNATVSDPILAGGVTNARINDLELKSTFLGGAKGAFFESRPWLGFETDVYTLTPDVKQQTVVGGTTTGRVFADNIGPIPLRLTTWAVNIIIRSPSYGRGLSALWRYGLRIILCQQFQGGPIEYPYQSGV